MTWHHPKYYAALRAEKRKPQAASLKQAIQETVPWNEVVEAEASSSKLDHSHWGLPRVKAPSLKLQANQTPSCKPQAPSSKHQASSRKLQAP